MEVAVDGTTAIIAVVVFAGLIAGLIANRYVRPYAKSEVQGIKLETMIGPIVSITVLLLAFTLVTVYGGYQRALAASQDEARKVDNLYESAGFLKGPEKITIQSAMACYARAVANYEWPAMAEGKTGANVGTWSWQSEIGLKQALFADDDASAVLGAIITADRDRGETRSRRLSESTPAIPDAIKFFFLFCAVMAIFALATFTLPYVRRRVQVGVLVILSTLFIMFMVLITELDAPFYSIAKIPPTDITRVADDMGETFAEENPGKALPCDETGQEIPGMAITELPKS